jgi:hypothetical protein
MRPALILGLLALYALPASGAETSTRTSVTETDFAITLPGKWAKAQSGGAGDPWVYKCSEFGEQLTVSIHVAKGGLRAAEREVMLRDFVDIRRKAEVSLDSEMDLMDPKISTVGDKFTAFYQGRNKVGRYSANFTIVNEFGVANFYYEATAIKPEQFAPRVAKVLADISF